ncbi:hypothetical protein LUZ60_012283 [Juncus effusus]|nr:hypothetical protein LUZ60_012283 [Juncus effusus]
MVYISYSTSRPVAGQFRYLPRPVTSHPIQSFPFPNSAQQFVSPIFGMNYSDLIPGLPDEIAQECLVRVPYDAFPSVCHVCRLWKQEIESQPYHSLRKTAGVTVPVVISAQAVPSFAVSTEPTDVKSYTASSTISYRFTAFHPVSGEWTPLPPIPGLPVGIPLFCQLASVGRQLVVVGGWDPATWAASDWVFIYDFTTGSWRRGAPLPGPKRSFFSCAASENLVFVTGGHDNEKNALKSGFAYDVAADAWVPLPDMSIERDEPKGIFVHGEFMVLGGYITAEQGHFRRSIERFNPASWTWNPVEEDWLEEDPKSPNSCMARDGKVYKLREGGQVAVREGGTWRIVGELPEDARLSVRLANGADRGVIVIGSGSHGGGQVAYVAEEIAGKMTWRRSEVAEEFWGHIQGICSMEL